MTDDDRREMHLERWIRLTVGAGDESPSLTSIGERFRCGASGARRLVDRLVARGIIETSHGAGRRLAIVYKGGHRG